MSVSTKDALVAMLAASVVSPINKATASTTANRHYALFRTLGNVAASGTPTVSGAALDRTSAGALYVPAASGTTYLLGINLANLNNNTYCLYDRMVETGGLSGTVTTAQTVNSAALGSRYTSGEGCELWAEYYSGVGATARACTATYTNSQGVSGRTATLVNGTYTSPVAQTCQPFALQAGDTGIQSVQSVTLAASTGTAGNFGVTIRKPILIAPIDGVAGLAAGYPQVMTAIPDNACLELIVMAYTSSSGAILGNLKIGQG